MQIRTGQGTNTTCSVTNGSNIVNAAAGSDWSAVLAGSLFKLANSTAIYQVSADAAIVAGVWRILLTANYGQTTNAAASYVIQKDFLSVGSVSVPSIATGDDMTIINRWMQDMATALAAISNTFDNARRSPTTDNFQLKFPADGKFRDVIGIIGSDGEPRIEFGDAEDE